MISFQLFLLTTLMVNVWSNLNSPVSFKYSKSGFLKLNIVLKNVPPDISQYLLHAKTDRHSLNISRIYPKDGMYTIQCKLNVNYVAVDLEIKNNKASCAKLNILNGTRSTGVDGFEQQCLMNYGEKDCSIEVDFKNTCTDSRLECNIKEKTLICFSGNIERSEVTWSQHYIEYKDRHFGLPTKVNGTSYMKMKIYKFDNNSEVSIKSPFSMKYYTVSIPVDEAEDYELETLYIDKKIITYTFTCRDDNSKVGVLYDNGSKLTIYANNIVSWSRQSEPLNRYACCVQLKIYNKDDGLGIERIVNQFTHIRDKPTQEMISVKPMCTMEAGYTLHCKCMETQNIHSLHNYKWSQFTAKNDEIGTKYQKIWSFQTKSSILKMLIYKFDNNTIIICEENSQEITKHTNNNNNPIPKTFTIRIPGGKTESVQYNTLRAEGISEVISFSKSEEIKVNCSTNAYVGLIYHKEEIIERQNSTSFYIKNHSDISYRACCIYFESAGAYLIREIKNISLLVNIQTSDPVTPITTTSPVEPVSDNQDEVESTTSNLGLYIVLPTLLIVIILLLIIALRFKKRRNPRESQQMLQLETYGTTEKVLYAELALKPRNDHRVPVQTNESPYAEIVGVLNEHRGKPPQLNRSRAESRRT
ncbi:unnamed protein product [Spodoptera littoralis]|uniref:Uncharacterized protein n=1 Tax=Spodoptera littoralis TaxID=7109 RepID=A0A9P0I746_SPOLI|nr:unnamed protein product [Spodoptera littoralis]CAH1642308.1 unnamed protein product [Spodoptera littoralis]